MTKQTFIRLRSAAFAGTLVLAPVAGIVATAPIASASVVVIAETEDPTPALDGTVIHNPDGQDIMPIDAPITVEPISAPAHNPWPGRIGWGIGGTILGSLLGHLFHRRRYVQFESRV